MKATRLIFFAGALSAALISGGNAQTADDFALLKKINTATRGAPASRMTSTVTDRDSGTVLETMTMERVAPDKIHIVTTHHGQPASEMISDGKRSLRRHGPDEAWKVSSINLGAMFRTDLDFDEGDIREHHIHLKPLGDDRVEGTAAKVYELTSDEVTSKIWLAADTSRILKVERDYDDSGPIDRRKLDGDLKSLQAQLKAASTRHHLHSLTLYSYGPSIKITMPPNEPEAR